MKKLLGEVRACTVCHKYVPNAPRPVLQANNAAKIVIIGQAPGPGRVMPIVGKLGAALGQIVQPVVGADPQAAFRIFHHGGDAVAGQSAG